MRFLLTLALGLLFALGAQAQTTQRALRPETYTRGAMALELNGVTMGMVRSIAGGAIYGEVITDKGGPGRSTNKRIGAVRYEPIIIEVGLDMVPQFWELIRQWPATSKPQSGAILFGDINYRQLKRMEFTNALITEIGFPALDAAEGKKAFSLLVTLQPSKIENRPGKGTINASAAKSRPAFCSNFRLTASGLDLSRVTKVDAFAIKQKVAASTIGELRRFELEPASIEYEDLVLTLPETFSTSVENWLQDAVVKGSGRELDFRLEILDPTLKATLVTLNLRGVGIWKLSPAESSSSSANVQKVSTVDAWCYMEGVAIDIK